MTEILRMVAMKVAQLKESINNTNKEGGSTEAQVKNEALRRKLQSEMLTKVKTTI